jgi:coenzyme F420-reducing hydrogenase delta subunit
MEKKVKMFDPNVKAYRFISIEDAKKFIESAENVKKRIDEIEKDNKQ